MGDSKITKASSSPTASTSPDSAVRPPRVSIIQLSFDSTTGSVSASLTPDAEASVATLESVRQQLEEAGYGRFYTSDEILQTLVRRANDAEAGDYVIAERRDARLTWRIADDKKAVFLTAVPAYGGKPPERGALLEALQELKVPERCVLRSALDELVAIGQADNLCVAKALEPVQGEDTRFELLVEACKDLQLTEDERGRVDLHQLHEFVVVEPGTPLLRRIPASAGQPGINVAGEELPAKPGRELDMSKDSEGTLTSPDDPNLLVAQIKGHPVAIARGVRVDPTLRVKNVDLSTGDIDFDGSLEVTGDVTSGFVVRATGDIFVRGVVEKADVEARKNLTVLGGVIGEDLGRGADKQLILRTRLRAGGDIAAKFVNLADLVAAGDIVVREYIMQSHLRAGNAISLGQAGGKGCLLGGRAEAAQSLRANVLGSDAGVATEVRIGKPNPKRRLLEALKQAVLQSEHNIQKLAPLLETVEQRAAGSGPSPEKLAKIRLTLDALRQKRLRLKGIVQRLTARQKMSRENFVDVKKALHANVTLTIDGVSCSYQKNLAPRCLVRSGAELVSKA